jgi:hypothetical protein
VSLLVRAGSVKVKTEIMMRNDSHQLVTWALSNSDRGFTPMVYISGVYLAPRVKIPISRTVKALKLLQDNFVLPTAPNSSTAFSSVYHIITGDFNAYTGVVQELHVSQDRYRGIPRRIGDAKHQPHASITETGATTEPGQRGHLLLRLVNDLKLLIVNGRFEPPDSPPPLTTKTTIVDYFLLHSEVFVDVRSCRIHHDTLKTPDSFGIGSDHKLMSLTLALPWDASNDTKESMGQRGNQRKAPRTRFMTEKLKNAAIQSEFTAELERRSPATRNQLLQLQEQHAHLVLPTQTFIDQPHALVVDMMQGVAAKVLSSPNPTHRLGGHPMRAETRERNHQRTLATTHCFRRFNSRRIL